MVVCPAVRSEFALVIGGAAAGSVERVWEEDVLTYISVAVVLRFGVLALGGENLARPGP